MYQRGVRFPIILLVMLSTLISLTACGKKDYTYNIGVVGSGSKYTAQVEITNGKWSDLTENQKNDVVDECIDTVNLSSDLDDKQFKLTGVDKTTNEQIFAYDSKTQKTKFSE